MAKQATVSVPEQGGMIPPNLMKSLQKGAEALFYTAAQVARSKVSGAIVKQAVAQGDLLTALTQCMEQGIRHHVKDGLPLQTPMVLGAAYYVAQYLASLAKTWETPIDPASVKDVTLQYIEDFMTRADSLDQEEPQLAEGMEPTPPAGLQDMPPTEQPGEPMGGLMQ